MVSLKINGIERQFGSYIATPIKYISLTTNSFMRINIPTHQVKQAHDYMWDLVQRADEDVLIEFNGVLMGKQDVNKVL